MVMAKGSVRHMSTNAQPLTDLELERARKGSTYRNERWLATVDAIQHPAPTDDPPCGCDNPLHDHDPIQAAP